MNPKEQVGEAALMHVSSGMAVGLGTGSTADFFLIALGREIRSGNLRDIVGVPSSERSRRRAEELGIPLTTLSQTPQLDVAIDGADEIAPGLKLIKGLGGALLREKILAQAAKKFIVIADPSKIVEKLGKHAPLPVEVVTFEHPAHMPFFLSIGARPVLRTKKELGTSDTPFITDNGNVIYDLWFPSGIDHPEDLEHVLLHRAGVVETGLFLRIAKLALIATPDGTEERHA